MATTRVMFPVVVLLAGLLIPASLQAAVVSGRITDASNGKPVVFATVKIVELDRQSHTDADGRYVFNDLPAGRYTVAVSFAGYSDYAIGVLDLTQEAIKTLDAALQPDAAPLYGGSPALAPSVSPREMDPQSRFSLREFPVRLGDLPLRGYEDFVAILPGTVRRYYSAPLHVRGGRIEEFDYRVDGFSQQDPLTGESFTAINGNAIDEIRFRPGYRDPSNGWAISGQTDVASRESWSTGGAIEVSTDNFHGEKSDYALYALDLTGPLIASTPERLIYAVAGEYRTLGNRAPGEPEDWNYLGAWHANLRWRPNGQTSAFLGTRGTYGDWKYTPSAWTFNAEHALRGVDENYSIMGRVEHAFTFRTRLTAQAQWFSARHRQGDGVYFDDLWAYGRPGMGPYSDATSLYYAWDDMLLDPDSLEIGRQVSWRTPAVESTITVPLPDGGTRQQSFVVRGDESYLWDDYLEEKDSYIGGRIALVHSQGSNARTQGGLEFQRHTVRSYQNIFPGHIYLGDEGGLDDINRYGFDIFGEEDGNDALHDAPQPLFLAGFASQHWEFGDLTLNGGLRWDHFDYDTQTLLDPHNPLDPHDLRTYADTATGLSNEERNRLLQASQELNPDDLTDAEAIDRLSPRLSVSLRVTEDAALRFHGGRYIQRPPLEDIYPDYGFLEHKVRTGGYAFVFPNPSLPPTEVVAVDAGWNQRLHDGIDLGLTLFQKNYDHIAGAGSVAATPNSFSMMQDQGSATARGIEAEIGIRRQRGITAQFHYSYTDISDDESYANTQSNIAWTSAPVRLAGPFTFEQEHRLVGIVDLRTGPNAGPMLGDWHPLENAGVTFLGDFGSGFPYTPTQVHAELFLGFPAMPVPTGPIGSERTPSTARVDVRANKTFALRGAEVEIYLWVINLFDRENAVDVYSGTGEPDNTGWLGTPDGRQFADNFADIHDASFLSGEQKYQLRQNDPANLDIPRQIRIGMRLGF